MARFNAAEVENYGGQGGGGYFSLRNDKDTARVRFMYNDINDVVGYAVHQVEIDGKKRYVNCLREYNQPMSDCPLCAAKNFQLAKLFIPLYDVDEQKVKIWDRGKKFFSKISSLCARYSNPSVVAHVFEIERNGKPGDQTTSYEIYSVDSDDTRMEDLPEVPELIGGLILDKSVDDMNYYLEAGEFPPEDGDEPVRRRESAGGEIRRRTPSRNRDRF